MNSYYKCESHGRMVTVWPSTTGEAAFFDVVVHGATVDDARNIPRVTAYEAAAIVLTELGTPLHTTVASVEGMIRRWRADLDAQPLEPVR